MGDLWLLPFVLSDLFILGAKVDGTNCSEGQTPSVDLE
jgi:hypothetical protein